MAYRNMDMGEFIRAIRWQHDHSKDLRIDANQVSLMDDGRVRFQYPDDIATPTPYFMQQVRAQINETFKVRLEADYWNACANQIVNVGGTERNLLAINANNWLGKMESRHLIRTFTQDVNSPRTARAFLSNKYKRVDNFSLLVGVQDDDGRILQPGLLPFLQKLQDQQDYMVRSCDIAPDGGKMYLKFSRPSKGRKFVIPSGQHRMIDEVEFGVECGNSELGKGRYYGRPYSFRYWCDNLAGHPKYGIAKNHSGRRIEEEEEESFTPETIRLDDMVIVAKMVDIVKACMEDSIIDEILADMSRAAGIEVKKPVKAVEYLRDKNNLTNAVADAILAAFVAGTDPAGTTLWGLTNAVTTVAKDNEIVADYDMRTELENLGGSLISLTDAELRPLVEAR